MNGKVELRVDSARKSARFLARVVAIFGCMIWAAGCSVFQREGPAPQGLIRVSALATVPDALGAAPPRRDRAPRLRGLRGETFEAEGRGIAPNGARDEVQGLALARVQARREALRSLAVRVVAFRPRADETIGQSMRAYPEWRRRLAQTLEAEAEISYERAGDEVIARSRIDGEIVADALRSSGVPAPEASEGDDPDAEEQQMALRETTRRRALEMAHDRLYEEVLKTEMPQGPLKSVVADNSAIRQNLDEMLSKIEPEEVLFSPNGDCKVVLTFERARLLDLVR